MYKIERQHGRDPTLPRLSVIDKLRIWNDIENLRTYLRECAVRLTCRLNFSQRNLRYEQSYNQSHSIFL